MLYVVACAAPLFYDGLGHQSTAQYSHWEAAGLMEWGKEFPSIASAWVHVLKKKTKRRSSKDRVTEYEEYHRTIKMTLAVNRAFWCFTVVRISSRKAAEWVQEHNSASWWQLVKTPTLYTRLPKNKTLSQQLCHLSCISIIKFYFDLEQLSVNHLVRSGEGGMKPQKHKAEDVPLCSRLTPNEDMWHLSYWDIDSSRCAH